MSRYAGERKEQPTGTRERIIHDVNARSASGREGGLLFGLAIVTFLLVAAISVRQATDPGRAANVLANAVAATTEIDPLLREHLAAMKSDAQAGRSELLTLPGYPVDVYLTRDEVLKLDETGLRDLILRRSASIVYDEGLKAFDHTGHQDLGLLSVQGQMDLVIDKLTSGTHGRAGLAAAILGLLFVALAVPLLLLAEGNTGFRKAGVAIASGAGFGLLLSALAWAGAGLVGGGDPFVTDLRDIVRTLLATPMRNYVVVAIAGVLIAALSPLADAALRAAGLDEGGGDEDAGSPLDAPGWESGR